MRESDAAFAMEKSAVSEKFIAMSARKVKELLKRDLSKLRLSGVNYFSRSATITLFAWGFRPSTQVLTGAEDKALQGCNLSADSGARPGRWRRKPPRRF